MKPQIIQQGAEAIIYKINNKIVKDRISKKYRHPKLDLKLRKSRTKSEAKILDKLKNIINVPKILANPGIGRMIHMEYIKGKKLSDNFNDLKNKNKIAEQIGREIAKIHDFDIIHGDLTTSNIIYVEGNTKNSNIINSKTTKAVQNKAKNNLKNNKVSNNNKNNFKIYFIDFGLGFHSKRIEDKAVDLHLIKQALEAKHFKYWKELFDFIIKGYDSKDKGKILEQLKKVESRGRYKKH